MQTQETLNVKKDCVPKVYLLDYCVKLKNIYRNNIIIGQFPRLAHHGLFIYIIENTSTTKIITALNYLVKLYGIFTILKVK